MALSRGAAPGRAPRGHAFLSDNVKLAMLALGLFALLYQTTGQIDVEGGLGYDGRVYAGMI